MRLAMKRSELIALQEAKRAKRHKYYLKVLKPRKAAAKRAAQHGVADPTLAKILAMLQDLDNGKKGHTKVERRTKSVNFKVTGLELKTLRANVKQTGARSLASYVRTQVLKR